MNRRVILIAVFVAGGALLLLMLWWRLPVAAPPAAGSIGSVRPSQFAGAAATFSEDPARIGVDEVVSRIGAAVRSSGIHFGEDADALAAAVERRTRLLLAPDFDEWRSQVRADGGRLPEWAQGGEPDEQDLRKWKQAADGLRLAPVSASELSVRAMSPDDPPLMGVPGTRFMRPSSRVSASYRPPAAGASAVEVLIPVRFRCVDGAVIPATMAMRFYREGETIDWRPFDLILYFDEQSMGRTLQIPIF